MISFFHYCRGLSNDFRSEASPFPLRSKRLCNEFNTSNVILESDQMDTGLILQSISAWLQLVPEPEIPMFGTNYVHRMARILEPCAEGCATC